MCPLCGALWFSLMGNPNLTIKLLGHLQTQSFSLLTFQDSVTSAELLFALSCRRAMTARVLNSGQRTVASILTSLIDLAIFVLQASSASDLRCAMTSVAAKCETW